MELQPGKALGDFVLGTHVNQVVSELRKQYRTYPQVQLSYCFPFAASTGGQQETCQQDIVIQVFPGQFRLGFCRHTQRLRSIRVTFQPSNKEVAAWKRPRIHYRGKDLSSPSTSPDFLSVYDILGPSYPGVFDGDAHTYRIQYPQLRLEFQVDEALRELYSKDALPLKFGTHPAPSCLWMELFVVEQPSLEPAILLANPRSGMKQLLLGVQIQTSAPRGIRIQARASPDKWSILSLGRSMQDAISILGPPSRIHRKTQDPMRIHSPRAVGAGGVGATMTKESFSNAPKKNDVFYNYFEAGLDLLFDAVTYRLKKVVFHGNCAHHVEFGRYARCPLQLLPGVQTSTVWTQPWSSVVSKLPFRTFAGGDDGDDGDADDAAAIGKKGIVVDRSYSLPNGEKVESPFGSTAWYGRGKEGFIFEVLADDRIATVILYQ